MTDLAVAALVAWNVATQILHARREQRLLDAVMTRTPAEYIAAKRADTSAAAKPKQEPLDPSTLIPIGL